MNKSKNEKVTPVSPLAYAAYEGDSQVFHDLIQKEDMKVAVEDSGKSIYDWCQLGWRNCKQTYRQQKKELNKDNKEKLKKLENSFNAKRSSYQAISETIVKELIWAREAETISHLHATVIQAKKRQGGVGIGNIVELSPWVEASTVFKKLAPGTVYEYVFDPVASLMMVNISTSRKASKGHPYIRAKLGFSEKRICGGEIVKLDKSELTEEVLKFFGSALGAEWDEIFLSNEESGHFGKNWDDNKVFHFIELMRVLGIYTIHEPFHIRKFFAKLGLDQKIVYQDSFLRKFPGSIFNPSFYLGCVMAPHGPAYQKQREDPLYEETEPGVFQLKKEYHEQGWLDYHFNFRPSIAIERPEIEEDDDVDSKAAVPAEEDFGQEVLSDNEDQQLNVCVHQFNDGQTTIPMGKVTKGIAGREMLALGYNIVKLPNDEKSIVKSSTDQSVSLLSSPVQPLAVKGLDVATMPEISLQSTDKRSPSPTLFLPIEQKPLNTEDAATRIPDAIPKQQPLIFGK